MSRVVQIPLSDDEYKELEEKANTKGSTIAQYIKDTVLPGNDFKKWFPQLLKRVNSMDTETNFNIRAVMSTDWVSIPKGIKLALGRVFYQHVAAGKVENVSATKMDSAKTQWYIKEKKQ